MRGPLLAQRRRDRHKVRARLGEAITRLSTSGFPQAVQIRRR